jgi:hypothetical protein
VGFFFFSRVPGKLVWLSFVTVLIYMQLTVNPPHIICPHVPITLSSQGALHRVQTAHDRAYIHILTCGLCRGANRTWSCLHTHPHVRFVPRCKPHMILLTYTSSRAVCAAGQTAHDLTCPAVQSACGTCSWRNMTSNLIKYTETAMCIPQYKRHVLVDMQI